MDAKGKKILIADDEPDILEVLQYNLVREGYEVITAKDGDDALLKAKIHPSRPDHPGYHDAKEKRGGGLRNPAIPTHFSRHPHSHADRIK